MHNSLGELVGSVAVGPDLVRHTDGKGRKTFISAVPHTKAGWHHLKPELKFAQVVSKNGAIAIYGVMVENSVKLRLLLNVTSKGFLVVRMQQPRTTTRLEWRSQRTNATFTTVHAALSSLVDDPGSWTGDDDFAGTFTAQKRKRTSPRSSQRSVASQRRTASTTDVLCDGYDSTFDSDPYDHDLTDFSDPIDVGGDLGYRDPGDIGIGPGPTDTGDLHMYARLRSTSAANHNATLSADEQAFILCISAAAFSGPVPIVPLAIVLAKLSYGKTILTASG
jgi:hypothetical protein